MFIKKMNKFNLRYGAEVVENRASHSRSGQSQIFSGTGYRLGETADDSQG